MFKYMLPIVFITNTLCWKPLMPPTSYSITQQHPALGKTDNGLHDGSDSATGSSHSHQTISFHGNSFPSSDDGGVSPSSSSGETSYLNDDDDDGSSNPLPGYTIGEGRILPHKGTFYDKKLFEVGPSSVSKKKWELCVGWKNLLKFIFSLSLNCYNLNFLIFRAFSCKMIFQIKSLSINVLNKNIFTIQI